MENKILYPKLESLLEESLREYTALLQEERVIEELSSRIVKSSRRVKETRNDL